MVGGAAVGRRASATESLVATAAPGIAHNEEAEEVLQTEARSESRLRLLGRAARPQREESPRWPRNQYDERGWRVLQAASLSEQPSAESSPAAPPPRALPSQ